MRWISGSWISVSGAASVRGRRDDVAHRAVTLADLQRPRARRLEHVPQELRRIVEADFASSPSHRICSRCRGDVRPTLRCWPTRPAAHSIRAPPRWRPWSSSFTLHAGPRRLGGPFGAPAGMPTVKLPLQPPGLRDHGETISTPGRHRAGPARRPRAAPSTEPVDQRDDGRRDAPASGPRPSSSPKRSTTS